MRRFLSLSLVCLLWSLAPVQPTHAQGIRITAFGDPAAALTVEPPAGVLAPPPVSGPAARSTSILRCS